MTRQQKKKGESLDSLLRKFKRKVKNDGILQEYRNREHFEKPSERRKKDKKAAQIRNKTEQRQNELL